MISCFVRSKRVSRPERFSTVFTGEGDSFNMGFHVLVDDVLGLAPLGSFTTNSTDSGPVSSELDILQDHLFCHFSGGIVRIH